MIREKRVSNLDQSEVNLVYQYDASGAIIGFTYYPSSGTASQYFFGKNAQGDVLCIYDASGVLMAGYAYDAWGACTVAYDHSIIDVADINPIRYRSYYYDTETGWYYLQSRYYDPTVGRFISPDDPSLLGANGDLLSFNLYAYCSNNPVNYSDPSGHFTLVASIAIFVAITFFCTVDGAITAAQAGQDIGIGAFAGFISGIVASGMALFCPPSTLLGLVVQRGATSLVYGGLNEFFQTGTISNEAWAMIGVDVAFDVFLSMFYANSIPTPVLLNATLNEVLPVIVGAPVDSIIDILQTGLIYVPILQSHPSYSFSCAPTPPFNGSFKESLTPLMDNSIFKPTYI